jgi:hypothetical protein
MALKRRQVLATALWLLSACGGDAEGDVPMTPVAGNGMGPAQSGQSPDAGSAVNPGLAAVNDGAVSMPASDAAADVSVSALPSEAGTATPDTGTPATLQPYDYTMQEVPLSENLVIAKGKTLRVGPGVKFNIKSNLTITVQGTLEVEGSQAAPSSFKGPGAADSWHGIVVESGGSLKLQHASISGAKYGFHALPGSSFAVDYAVFDTSFKGAVLQADGTISHSIFKAGLLFPAITEPVAIDDPNGYLTIIDASPTVTHSRFEGSGGLNDMVRIGGNAAPKFDHCLVNNSHCGFHTNGGVNTSARITNTIFESLSYGVMAYTTKPIIENSVFRRNGTDIGMCSGATSANAASVTSNFYEGGAIKLDASCDKIGIKDPSGATSANPSAGPSGL